jgi:ABC-type phosphate transport system substrate-binding protein
MFTKITKIILHLIVLLLVVVACTSAEEVSDDASIPAQIVLTASGSGSVTPILEVIAPEISSWSEVGGADLPVILYIRDEEDSNTKILREILFNDQPFSQAAEVLTSEANMLVAVEGTPGGIGIATWPTTLAKKTKVEAVTIDGLAPNWTGCPRRMVKQPCEGWTS